MAHPVFAPRVNNNDDTVTIARFAVGVGDFVHSGELILEVETEKAVVAVEAEQDGYVLALRCSDGDQLPVGAVAVWLGEQADEQVPAQPEAAPEEAPADAAAKDAVTGKARLLLAQHGLRAEDVPRAGARLSAADVEAYLARQPASAAGGLPAVAASPALSSPAASPPEELPAAAELAPLSARDRGVLATVTWQRDHAATAYLEIVYDPGPWRDHAAAFGRDRRLLLSPLLGLMAHRLARLAVALDVNGTVLEAGAPQRVRYRHVNLGFTVQAGERLYLCVVEQAEAMDEAGFVAKLGELQRRAMAHRLAPAETRGATVGLTSMARWGVRRHMPVLAPYTALMVAHSGGFADDSQAVLGITYDHRLLSGFDAVRLLRLLADPAGALPERKT